MIKDKLDENPIYYVYEWIRLDTNEPFYVGKGKGDRAYNFNNRNYYFNNLIKELDDNNIDYAVYLLHENLTEEVALQYEAYYIHIYDFEYGFDLTNITWGGDGSKAGDFAGINLLPRVYDTTLKPSHKEQYEVRYKRRMIRNQIYLDNKELKDKEELLKREERKNQSLYNTKEKKLLERIHHNAKLLEVDSEKLEELLLPLSELIINEERYKFLEELYEKLKPDMATFGMLGKKQTDNQKSCASNANKKSFCVLYSDNKKEVYNSRTEAVEILSKKYDRFNDGVFRKFILEKNKIKIKVEVEPNYYIIGIFCLNNKKGETLIKLNNIKFDGNIEDLKLYGKAKRIKIKVIFKDNIEMMFNSVVDCKKYLHENYQVSSFTVDKLLKSGEPLNSRPCYYNLYQLNGMRIEEVA